MLEECNELNDKEDDYKDEDSGLVWRAAPFRGKAQTRGAYSKCTKTHDIGRME